MTGDGASRWWAWPAALEDRVAMGIILVLLGLWVLAAASIYGLGWLGRLSAATKDELRKRLWTWLALMGALIVPLLLGSGWVILGSGLLGLLCYREYARATGLFREPWVHGWILLGIVMVTFATLDHWYGFFVALPALGTITIAAVAMLADRPSGYIQRLGLATLAFLLFGVCLGHLGYLANDGRFRALLLLLLVSVGLNDIFAYLSGRAFGRRPLAPATSPNKTIGGALGALCGTTVLYLLLGGPVFAGTPMDAPLKLIGLGLLVSIAGQMGDLVISSVKRDLGLKDMGVALPGHGGFLDRFDSLLLVAPTFFHFVGYFNGIGLDQPVRLFTGP